MLERTAGCLESGSLRRLLPVSRKPLKSRRTLHSGFWSHAAGDPELSPFWAALVQVAEPSDTLAQDQQHGNGGTIMEFLYPSGTFNLIHQYSSRRVDRQELKNARSGKFGHRNYTSAATDNAEDLISDSQISSNLRKEITEEDVKEMKQAMKLDKEEEFEEAWTAFIELNGETQTRFRAELIQYLSKSKRVVDAERITELFASLDAEGRTAMVYESAICAYLKLRNLADAMTLHRAAVDAIGIPVGAQDILPYLMSNSQWSQAFNLWKSFREVRMGNPDGNYEISSMVETLPALSNKALELVSFVKKRADVAASNASHLDDELQLFAAEIVRIALKAQSTFDEPSFDTLFSALQDWQLDSPSLYTDVVYDLLRLKQANLAVRYYQEARKRGLLEFTTPILEDLLSIFCANHNIPLIQQILDDFFQLHERPTRKAYRLCITAFSRQGDVKTVRTLFEQYVERFGVEGRRLLHIGDILPLLHVHARRGEVNDVLRIFNHIQEQYGVEPDIRCWNVLLSAYGKLHDTDSAYQCFEHILSSSKLQPDHYTFGTVMGVCAMRGDFQRVLELYKLSHEMKIERSCAMIDCLVLGHLQQDLLVEAEEICNSALHWELKGSRTRMWNYLLVAHAMRRDLPSVTRILKRMSDVEIQYDQYTYAALLQSLAICRTPAYALKILTHVMPSSGITPNSFHYAIVMGGYIAIREFSGVFRLRRLMSKGEVRKSPSSELQVLKALAHEDQKLVSLDRQEGNFRRSMKFFKKIISNVDLQGLSSTARKGIGQVPLDVTYSAMFYKFIIYVLGKNGKFAQVDELYNEFLSMLPASKKKEPPVEVLSALMASKVEEGDFEGVQKCWELALEQARRQGSTQPLPDSLSYTEDTVDTAAKSNDTEIFPLSGGGPSLDKILPAHRLKLVRPLQNYMEALNMQGKIDQIKPLVLSLESEGFTIDDQNWNLYVNLLVENHKYRQAFEICEERLMHGWTGWAHLRRRLPMRSNLPLEIRNLLKDRKYLKAHTDTIYALARAYMELLAQGAEDNRVETLLNHLEVECPMILKAIKTIDRSGDEWLNAQLAM